MNANMNLFEWVRDSVRRSVLLGFSDAVEQIGLPSTDEEIHPNVSALLQVGDAAGKTKARKTRGSGRKRLGKTLKEMNAEE
ncbi:hypothetical protein K239x_10260 [Planctomycetes bacterium K23_9]|uniref:Uncharacterized protein n=2 Tax=Stieleria marina TaxID=1930275 RepID=A0A517NPN2_9BACT|nr:hypothetical protein K239x_10260 [Planctomycetes bacterium K23_9]